MKRAIVIVGAGYGDEGKGLMTDFFVNTSPPNTIVVRYNGGAQAGHTVITPQANHHVFSHFGSGTFVGAATYLGSDFIVNPILFNIEHGELTNFYPRVLVSTSARCTVPYDMLLNQAVEEARVVAHGSCGVGIFETIRRCSNENTTLYELSKLTLDQLTVKLEQIRTNTLVQLKTRGILSPQTEAMLALPIAEQFYDSIECMCNRITWADDTQVCKEHDVLIFEGAQGLLLNQLYGTAPHLTPSDTGALVPVQMLEASGVSYQAEIVYVTRAYATRHGAGPLDNECSAEALELHNVANETNQQNAFQGAFRYAPLDVPALHKLVAQDFARVSSRATTTSLAVTCLDQVPESVKASWVQNTSGLLDTYSWVYFSEGPTRETITFL